MQLLQHVQRYIDEKVQFTRQEPKRSGAGRIGKVSQMLIDKHREEAGGQDHSVKYSSRYAKSAKNL